MPLRQTMLGFKVDPLPSPAAETAPSIETTLDISRTSSSVSEVDEDTIVVDLSEPRAPLPTPSESATDVSSQSSQILSLKEVAKGHARRVVRVTNARKSQDCLLEQGGAEQGRSVSGETLVTSTSQSSLLQSGIAALNLPWSMSSVFRNGSQGDLVVRNDGNMSTASFDTMNDEEEQMRLEKLAAKRAKIEENNRLREAKRKAEDEKATRRSSRTSMLGKAGDLMSSLTATVLGKRARDGPKNGARPQSMIEAFSAATPSFEGPMSKRRRLSDGDMAKVTAENDQSANLKKSFSKRKEKRWLTSGMYAGQARTFDGRLTESKNKTKQNNTERSEPQRENTVLPLPMFAGDRLLQQGRDFKLPFDIFSPLPAGQPKPDEWRKTNKNVFVGDAAQEWRETRFEEQSMCMCVPEVGCDSNCMNRFMYYECDDRNCKLTEEQCGNRSFDGLKQRSKKGGKYNVGVEVIKTVDRGYGVRSNRTFEPNQIIVEYTGEIINQEECESRMRTIYKDNACYYLMLFDQNMIIDATRGSIARFVNHSCEPNCRMEKWTVGGKPRMALFAGDKGIMTGEELTYDYNFDPYSQKNVQECRCGAKTCRGVLGPKPKDGGKPKVAGDEPTRPESRLAGAKRKIAGAIDQRLSKKKKIIAVKTKVFSPARRNSGKMLKKRITSVSRATTLSRRPSKLKRMIASAKERSNSKRVISTSSASERLLVKETTKSTLSRSASVKAKAVTLKKSVVRTVRGGRHGKNRSIRPVEDEE